MTRIAKFIRWLGRLLVAEGRNGLLARISLFLIILVPVIALGASGYKSIYDGMTESTISERRHLTHVSSILLTERLNKLVDLGISLARRPRVTEAVAEGDWEKAIKVLENVPGDFPFIDYIFLADIGGTFMASVPPAPDLEGKNFASRDWYKGVSQKWEPYISEIYRRAIEPRLNVIAIAIPVRLEYTGAPERSPGKGEAIAILVLQIRPEILFEWTKEAGIGRSSFIYVIDKNGHLVFHPKFPFQGDIIDYSGMPTTKELLENKSGVAKFFNPSDREVEIAVYEPIERYGWGVVVAESARSFFAARNKNFALAMVIYGLFIFLGFVIAYLVIRIVTLYKDIEIELESYSRNLEGLVTERTGELRENEERFRAAVEQAAVGFAQIDLAGRWVLVNQKLCSILGYTKEELLKLKFQDVTYPADLDADLTGMKRALAGERNTYAIEKRYVRKDGHPVWVNMTVSGVCDSSKQLKYFICVIEDISERKRIEDELLRLASFPMLSPVPIVEIDVPSNAVSYLNPAALDKFPDLQSLGTDHPILKDVIAHFPGIAREKRPYGIETQISSKTYEHLIYYVPEENKVRSYINDITERKQLEGMKTEFVSTVSHEIRTPLSISKEAISLILDGTQGEVGARQGELLAVAKNNIDRLARIIDDLLDISKIEAGRIILRRELINIADIVKEAAATFKPNIIEKGLALRLNIPKKKVEIYADPDKITQILTNLMGNAMKFTEKGFIEISISDFANHIECTVSDSGIGISREDIPRIFGKFQQFSRVPGGGEKGTGLGLSITKGLVGLHSGKIWVESLPGKGAAFTFSMPKYNSEALFKEYVDEGIKEAEKVSAKMSVVMLSLGPMEEVKKIFSIEEMRRILKEIEALVKGTLRRHGDIAVRDTGEMIIVLPGCDKDKAYKILDRIRGIIKDDAALRYWEGKLKLRFGTATYPDEGNSDDELLGRARESEIT